MRQRTGDHLAVDFQFRFNIPLQIASHCLFKITSRYAVVCNEGQAMSMRVRDFAATGRCNFYETEDKLNAALPARFAFQVRL